MGLDIEPTGRLLDFLTSIVSDSVIGASRAVQMPLLVSNATVPGAQTVSPWSVPGSLLCSIVPPRWLSETVWVWEERISQKENSHRSLISAEKTTPGIEK